VGVSSEKGSMLMKKLLFILILSSFVLLTFSGCGGKPYSFKEPIDKIESVEFVSAENSLEFTVIKTLSETEKNDFLEQFQAIPFRNYYVGDPMSVNGNAVKITYRNENYEMICHYWAEHVKNGEIIPIRKNCDEKAFNDLLNKFSGDDAP